MDLNKLEIVMFLLIKKRKKKKEVSLIDVLETRVKSNKYSKVLSKCYYGLNIVDNY